MRKSLSSLYLISNDKLLDISIINYYFFNKNICIYECLVIFLLMASESHFTFILIINHFKAIVSLSCFH
jgi:hypothetical protein